MKSQTLTALIASTFMIATPLMAQTPPAATPAPAETAPAATAPAATAPAATTAPAAGTTLATGSYTAPEGYTAIADFASVTADQLKGVDLHGPEAKDMGDVSDVELGADGKVSGVIADVGGFLGMGTHTVKLGLDEVGLFKNADGKIIAVTNKTVDALKATPEYTKPAQ